MIPDGPGLIRAGDLVEVLETGDLVEVLETA